MAETHPKRLREESHDDLSISDPDDSSPIPKRQKPYSNILNLLDEEDEDSPEPTHESNHDFSAILTTLQQELSSSTTTDLELGSLPCTAEIEADLSNSAAATARGTDEEEGLKSVLRHLLEASDDELGIPNRGDDNNNNIEINSFENFPFAFTDNVLWEFEDEAANYYTVLQSELFM